MSCSATKVCTKCGIEKPVTDFYRDYRYDGDRTET